LATALVLVLTLATADAADALSRQAIAEAEWSRDVERLLDGPYEAEDLARVATALGRTRDPAVLERLGMLAGLAEAPVRRAACAALGWVPGGATLLRDRLDREVDSSVRALALRGLGLQGDAGDLPRLLPALHARFPEDAAAAEAIGLLAGRGEDVAAAIPDLVAALADPDSRTVAAVAFALSRLQPRDLTPAQVAVLDRASRRAPDEATRAWLLPLLVAHLPDSARRARELEVLAGPFRAPKVALLSGALAESVPDVERLVDDPDPWVALAAARRLHPEPSTPAADRGSLALRGEAPAARTGAAEAIVADGPTVDDLARLGGADDVAVRAIAAAALAGRDEPEALARLQALVRAETAPEPLVPALDGLLRGLRQGRHLDPATALRVRDLAAHGPFLVRARAHAVAREAGIALGPAVPVLPGPADLDRDLDHVTTIRAARVLTTDGEIRLTLDPDTAPLAVATFAWLAEHGQLDDRPFFRVVPASVVQTGDPRGDGHGGPGWFLPDELSALPFGAGAVGMATSGPDTGGSQWFVTTTPQPHLAGSTTRFGVVSDGLDLVRRLDEDDRVLHVTIERVGEGK
jgi:cyclophilin family peptidyl-prolyl cis-trans isomerase